MINTKEENDTKDQNKEEDVALDHEINEELDLIFDEIDKNYNGEISAIELEEYLNALGKKGWVNCDDIEKDKKEGLDECEEDGKGWVDKREYYINAMWGDVERTEQIDKEHFRK